MARARKRTSASRRKKNRNGLLLAIGLGIGIAAVYLVQLLLEHNVHRTVASWFKRERPIAVEKPVKADKPRPKFFFYTILPETGTSHLTDRDPNKAAKTAKTEKPKLEEDVVYLLQAISYKTFEEADQFKAKLALQGLPAQIQKASIEGQGERYRVLLGPYEKPEDRDAVIEQLAKMGITAPLRLTAKRNDG